MHLTKNVISNLNENNIVESITNYCVDCWNNKDCDFNPDPKTCGKLCFLPSLRHQALVNSEFDYDKLVKMLEDFISD